MKKESIVFVAVFSCIICVFNCLIFQSCSNIAKEEDIAHISIKAATEDMLFSDIFESEYEVIKLETTSENQIGAVHQTVILKNHVFLLDNTNTIFIFNRDGSYVNKLCKQGKGPGQYISLMSFKVQEQADGFIIIINDPVNRKLLTYDQDIQFVKEQKVPFPFYDFEVLKSNQYVLFRNFMTGTSKEFEYDLVITDEKFKTLDKHFPYEFTNLTSGVNFPLLQNSKNLFFHTHYSNIVYQIDQNGKIHPHCKISFGNNELPSHEYFIKNKDKKRINKEIIKSNMVYSYVFNEINDKTIVSYYINKVRYLFIEYKNGKQIHTNRYLDDFGFRLSNNNIDFFNNDEIGFIVYPYRLFDELEESNIPLNSLLVNVKEEDNHVLVMLKLKNKPL